MSINENTVRSVTTVLNWPMELPGMIPSLCLSVSSFISLLTLVDFETGTCGFDCPVVDVPELKMERCEICSTHSLVITPIG